MKKALRLLFGPGAREVQEHYERRLRDTRERYEKQLRDARERHERETAQLQKELQYLQEKIVTVLKFVPPPPVVVSCSCCELPTDKPDAVGDCPGCSIH